MVCGVLYVWYIFTLGKYIYNLCAVTLNIDDDDDDEKSSNDFHRINKFYFLTKGHWPNVNFILFFIFYYVAIVTKYMYE